MIEAGTARFKDEQRQKEDVETLFKAMWAAEIVHNGGEFTWPVKTSQMSSIEHYEFWEKCQALALEKFGVGLNGDPDLEECG